MRGNDRAGLALMGFGAGFLYGGMTGRPGTFDYRRATGFGIGGGLIGFGIAQSARNRESGFAAIGTGAGLIYGGTRTARDGGWDWEKGAAGALSGAQIGLGVALISRGYGPKSNKDLLGQTLVGSGLGGLMSIDSDSPMSWKHWGDGTIVGGATAAGAALGQRYGGTKGMIKGSMLGNAAGQGLSVGLGLRDQVSVEEIAMTGVTTAAFVGMGAAAGQAARVAVRAASAAASTAAGRAVVSAAGRAGTAISEAASGGARMIGRGLKHRYGEEAISNWVHGTMGETIFHKPLEWAGTKAGLKVCFTGKMQLQLADGGWIRVADVCPGTMVASRDEHDENGAIAGKVVEEVFSRWGLVWEVNVDGKVIETTAEHPFWIAEQGWVAAHDLRVGDVVRLRDGWGKVEGVRDTGRWERVYNCRVCEWHTYFVGEASWGWSVWAHNANQIDYNPSKVLAAAEVAVQITAVELRDAVRLHRINAIKAGAEIDVKRNVAAYKYLDPETGRNVTSIHVSETSPAAEKVTKPRKEWTADDFAQDSKYHSEQLGWDKLPESVRSNPEMHILGLYSELIPCPGCTPFLQRVGLPGNRISYSWTESYVDMFKRRYGAILSLRQIASGA